MLAYSFSRQYTTHKSESAGIHVVNKYTYMKLHSIYLHIISVGFSHNSVGRVSVYSTMQILLPFSGKQTLYVVFQASFESQITVQSCLFIFFFQTQSAYKWHFLQDSYHLLFKNGLKASFKVQFNLHVCTCLQFLKSALYSSRTDAITQKYSGDHLYIM